MYIKSIVNQAGEPLRCIKKVNEGITQAVLYFDSVPVTVITKQGKSKFDNLNNANMFLRRV